MKKKKKGNNVIIFRAGFNKFRPFSTRTSSSADHYDGPECRVDFFFFFLIFAHGQLRAAGLTIRHRRDAGKHIVPGRVRFAAYRRNDILIFIRCARAKTTLSRRDGRAGRILGDVAPTTVPGPPLPRAGLADGPVYDVYTPLQRVRRFTACNNTGAHPLHPVYIYIYIYLFGAHNIHLFAVTV